MPNMKTIKIFCNAIWYIFIVPLFTEFAETFADCDRTWCRQDSTKDQFTKCTSVSPDGYTCNNPIIRYGSTVSVDLI